MYEVGVKTKTYPMTGNSYSTINFEMFSDDWEELQKSPFWKDVETFLREKKKYVQIETVAVEIYGPKCDTCKVDEIREKDKKLKILTGISLGASIILVILALGLRLFGM